MGERKKRKKRKHPEKLDRNEEKLLRILEDHKPHMRKDIGLLLEKKVGTQSRPMEQSVVRAITKRLRYEHKYPIIPTQEGIQLIDLKSKDSQLATLSLSIDLTLTNIDGNLKLGQLTKGPFMVHLARFKSKLTQDQVQDYLEKMGRIMGLLQQEQIDRELAKIEDQLALSEPNKAESS